MHRLLEQIGRVERLLRVRYGQRCGLLQEALPVALDAVEASERCLRRQLAVESARDCRRDRKATVVGLAEEVLELVDERAKLAASGAACP